MRWWGLLLLGFGAMQVAQVAQVAQAEDRSVSYSLWTVAGGNVSVRFTVPKAESSQLVKAGWPAPGITAVAAYVLAHLSVDAAGLACPAIDQGFDLGRVNILFVGEDRYAFEIVFRCSSDRDIVLRDTAWFARVPRHINFARIQVNGGTTVPQLFTASRQQLALPAGGVSAAGFGSYLRIGFVHILRSLDRMGFLLGMLLLVRRRQELVQVIAALAAGYGLATGMLWLNDMFAPRSSAIESWMGFMLLLLAAQLVTRELRRPRLSAVVMAAGLFSLSMLAMLAQSASAALLMGAGLFAAGLLYVSDWPGARTALLLGPAAVFGFLDGFSLSGDLLRLGLWLRRPIAGLTGFNTGALIAEALLIAVLATLAALARRKIARLPEALSRDLAATMLAGFGCYWLVIRLFA